MLRIEQKIKNFDVKKLNSFFSRSWMYLLYLYAKKQVTSEFRASLVGCIIDESSTIDGNVNVHGNVIINGTVNGDLTVKGFVIIGETGCVKGTINTGSIELYGSVDGIIVANNSAYFSQTARAIGDIFARHIEATDGAVIKGALNIISNANSYDEPIDFYSYKNGNVHPGSNFRAYDKIGDDENKASTILEANILNDDVIVKKYSNNSKDIKYIIKKYT